LATFFCLFKFLVFIVPSLYLLCCKYYREVVLLLKFSIQKIKEAEFFTRTDNSQSLRCICFFANRNSRFVLFASLQTEIVTSSEFASLQILSRRAFILMFSIQKIKEAEFFTRTDNSQSLLCKLK